MLEQNQLDQSSLSFEDTTPIHPLQPSKWRERVGWFCLLGAIAFTLGTVSVLMLPTPASVEVKQSESPQVSPLIQSQSESFLVESSVALETPTTDQVPTLSPQDIARLLSTPITPVNSSSMAIVRDLYDPFTFVPERPRDEIIQYTAVVGDTIGAIAERFGLRPETVAWSNPRSYIQILQPGNVLNILPVDGVLHTVLTEQTIASIAEQYNVSPYTIIDSEFNDLFGTTPASQLPSGFRVMIEGGTGEQIAWSPQVVRVTASGGGSAPGSSGQISFSPGDPGSCGLVDNPGGGSAWVRPISGYTWMRGYASWHPAADLAVPEGTTAAAANSGRVIFAGWNSFGYGYAVVLAHGPFTTIYAHLSAVNVRCGQDVAAGQVIAASGNTGNSTGPHLHFEVRYNDIPQDPTLTVAL